MNVTLSSKVTLILPVRRAGAQVAGCLRSICAGTVIPEIIVMDCTAVPGALDRIRDEFPQVRVFDFGMNPGRAHAVNTGIHLARTPYVMTFSPELIAGRHCVERLCRALDEDGSLLSAQARIMSADDPGRISGAGWRLSGWRVLTGMRPVKRGKSAKAPYIGRAKITAAQLEAAIYRMEYLEVTGILDERYYGWLEDLDLGYRGKLCGFSSLYEPQAVCRETRSAGTGADAVAGTGFGPGTGAGFGPGDGMSRFYSQLETGNMIYFRYKFAPENPAAGLWDRLRDPVTGLWSLMKERFAGSEAGFDEQAAVQRGRMLCFQAEMELMEREELGMSVTKQTLPEEFCLQVREDGPVGVYPLYLGERSE